MSKADMQHIYRRYDQIMQQRHQSIPPREQPKASTTKRDKMK